MIEREPTTHTSPFFSWSADAREYELFIKLDENNNYTALGKITYKKEDEEGIWVDDPKEWARHFIKLFGYRGYVDREKITVQIREDGKEITFTGEFGVLVIDDKSNLLFQLSEYSDPSAP
ncbi:hypothetical protein GX888_03420 [Candidatus Dojkabacteria bacterium]|uniref:Uncharacterized protein n=1 Tax=Candidatus Dojkabacteria bacterium TaxID=2099670 RepID=A0A847VEC3_9BACT|nr:hypothetical protein [Candidatus Dojkabacteria bacterium]